jgi:hypothetical protein
MSDEERISAVERDQAVTKNEQQNIERRVSSLEGNQKWVVLAIIGSVVKMLFDVMKGGGQ